MCAVFVKFTTVERNSVSDYFTKIKVKSIKVNDVVDEVVDEEVVDDKRRPRIGKRHSKLRPRFRGKCKPLPTKTN